MKKYKCRGVMLRRMARIERKCDMIISELTIIRHQSSSIDTLIERMHAQALQMRRQCRQEKRTIKELYDGRR